MLMITAGDAVAVATSWALYCVAKHPQVQDQCARNASPLDSMPRRRS